MSNLSTTSVGLVIGTLVGLAAVSPLVAQGGGPPAGGPGAAAVLLVFKSSGEAMSHFLKEGDTSGQDARPVHEPGQALPSSTSLVSSTQLLNTRRTATTPTPKAQDRATGASSAGGPLRSFLVWPARRPD